MQFYISTSERDQIIYSNLTWIANIWSINADTNLGIVSGEPVKITQDLMVKFDPSISRDGTKLAYSAFSGLKQPRSEIRLQDLVNGKERIIPLRGARTGQVPILSRNGSVLAYKDMDEGKFKTFIVRGEETTGRVVCDSCSVRDFFPDPNLALIQDKNTQFHRLNFASGEKILLLEAKEGFFKEPAIWISGCSSWREAPRCG